jgi:1-acyl-sn-glycerol-3-phosphate acyltransferase
MSLSTTPPLTSTRDRIGRMFAWLLLPYEYCVLYVGLLLFAVSFFAFSATATLIYPLMPRAAGTRWGRTGIMLIFRWYLAVLQATGLLKLDLAALDALRAEGALVIAPNHPSLLDAILIGSRLPRIVCIMKAGLQDNPILGGGARLAAYISDDLRLNMIRSATAALRGGNQLLMFPEGTRTAPYARCHFKGGYALIAKKAGVPVQTVIIESNSHFLGKGWPLFRKPVFPIVFTARLGRRFEVRGDVKAAVAEMEHYHRDALAARINMPADPDQPIRRQQRAR